MNQIPSEVRDRIITAANELYEESSREAFPTVDTVRRAAKADMNTTSTVMRDWRRQQTVQTTPVAVTVPEAVSQANSVALASMWQHAQELANESLRAAQAAWETEREEWDTMRHELANAYEEQAGELERVHIESLNNIEVITLQLKQANSENNSLRDELAKAVTRAERVEAKSEEIERRANELRIELDHAHSNVDITRKALSDEQITKQLIVSKLEKESKELADITKKLNESEVSKLAEANKHAEQYQSVLTDLATAGNERDAARILVSNAQQSANTAREVTAELRGELKATKQQLSELLKQLKLGTATKTEIK